MQHGVGRNFDADDAFCNLCEKCAAVSFSRSDIHYFFTATILPRQAISVYMFELDLSRGSRSHPLAGKIKWHITLLVPKNLSHAPSPPRLKLTTI